MEFILKSASPNAPSTFSSSCIYKKWKTEEVNTAILSSVTAVTIYVIGLTQLQSLLKADMNKEVPNINNIEESYSIRFRVLNKKKGFIDVLEHKQHAYNYLYC